MHRGLATTVITAICGLGALGGFIAGASVGGAKAGAPTAKAEASPLDYSRYEKIDLFARSLSLIEGHYVRPTDGERLIDGAIRGMVEELDPHSVFLDRAEAQLLREDIDGRFGGVGLVVDRKVSGEPAKESGTGEEVVYLEIRDVIAGGPADKAGLKVGDRIVAVEGKAIVLFSDLRSVISIMRGRPGTKVRFSVRSDGGRGESKEIEVMRAVVESPAVEAKALAEGLAWIRLRDFQDGAAKEIAEAMRSIAESSELDGVILDLRDNGGGALREAISLVNLFVEEGVIVRTRGRQGEAIESFRASRVGTRRNLPLVVLINKGSASASEIVAGALQDHQRALIIGERSYGKGSVQSLFELGDGSLLKLTTSLYYTPDDRLIQAAGIEPDLWVGPDAAPYRDSRPELESERAHPKHLRPEDFGRTPVDADASRSLPPIVAKLTEEDEQLAVAYRQLRAWSRLRADKRGASN